MNKIVDNFDKIGEFLDFSNKDLYYFIQIIQRKKENTSLIKNNVIIHEYCITSLEKYNFYKDYIKTMCEVFNARAYIYLNRRSSKYITLGMVSYSSKIIETSLKSNGQLLQVYPFQIHNKVFGISNHEINKTWIVDIDNISEVSEVNAYILKLFYLDPKRTEPKIMYQIPTVNGVHLICSPFDRSIFSKKYSHISIHKNNPTILYANTANI